MRIQRKPQKKMRKKMQRKKQKWLQLNLLYMLMILNRTRLLCMLMMVNRAKLFLKNTNTWIYHPHLLNSSKYLSSKHHLTKILNRPLIMKINTYSYTG